MSLLSLDEKYIFENFHLVVVKMKSGKDEKCYHENSKHKSSPKIIFILIFHKYDLLLFESIYLIRMCALDSMIISSLDTLLSCLALAKKKHSLYIIFSLTYKTLRLVC